MEQSTGNSPMLPSHLKLVVEPSKWVDYAAKKTLKYKNGGREEDTFVLPNGMYVEFSYDYEHSRGRRNDITVKTFSLKHDEIIAERKQRITINGKYLGADICLLKSVQTLYVGKRLFAIAFQPISGGAYNQSTRHYDDHISNQTTVNIYDIDTGEKISEYTSNSLLKLLITLPNGYIAGVADDNSIELIDAKKNGSISIKLANNSPIKSLVAYADKRLAGISEDNSLKIWDIEQRVCKHLSAMTVSEEFKSDNLTALVALSENQLATAGQDKIIRFWNPENGQCVKELKGHTESIEALAALSNERLASLDAKGTMRIWDIKTAKCVQTIKEVRRFKRCDPAITDANRWRWSFFLIELPNDELLTLTGDGQNRLCIWDMKTQECLQIITAPVSFDSIDFLAENNEFIMRIRERGCSSPGETRITILQLRQQVMQNYQSILEKFEKQENLLKDLSEQNKRLSDQLADQQDLIQALEDKIALLITLPGGNSPGIEEIRKKREAAVTLQATIRGFFTRREKDQLKADLQEVKEKQNEILITLLTSGKQAQATSFAIAVKSERWHEAIRIFHETQREASSLDKTNH